ncbi:exopolysaccharide transport protein family [Faunimonas pinastri]|uniref:Exopolysaccharide transport protein family n=1 Tax=Faunimonas pinastri TaxID=1855383 RepID=A0A1H9CB00_9HYPH|nr:exopolysaccharide transport family protein [Faunimonas pinastri]SEP98410.1 exopolysaccharide transport protein family [Faunimonas pinastri]
MEQVREAELDVAALGSALLRKLWLLIVLALLAAIVTYVALGFVRPLYTADTRILIEDRESPLTKPRDATGNPSSTDYDASAIASQVEVLRSREIASAVIDKLDLTHRPEFDPNARPSALKSFLISIGIGKNPAESSVRDRVMDTYYSRLSVYPVNTSRVLAAEFEGSNPQLAADVVNAIADEFVSQQQKSKQDATVAATQWLQQEIESLRGKVQQAEQKVSDYRASHGLFDVGTQNGDLQTQQLNDLNAELARAKADHAQAESRAQLIRSVLSGGGSLDSAEEVLNSPLIQRLREREVALRGQIADLSTTLLPAHPQMRSLNSQLQGLERQIRQEAQKILQSMEAASRISAAREQSAQATLNQAKAASASSDDQSIELRALEREAAAQRDLLQTLLGRYREAVARTDTTYLPADARIISRAVAPQKPSFPKKTMMSILAAVVMLLLAGAILLLREFTSGRAFRYVDFAPAPALTAAPEPAVTPSRELVAVTPAAPTLDDRPGTGELADVLAEDGLRTVVFAGADGSERVGEIAVASARLAALRQLRIILVDVGLHPQSGLGSADQPGLGDLLSGEVAFGDVIHRNEAAGIDVMPMGAMQKDPPMQRLSLVVGALSHSYDRVIVLADTLADWPNSHIKADLVVLVCNPELDMDRRLDLHEKALELGARNALIVRYTSRDGARESASAAA